MDAFRRRRLNSGTVLSPVTISLAYCLLSIAWILLSDRFTAFIPDRSVAQQVQSIKGVGFVAGTTLLMFALISRYRGRIVQAAEQRARRTDLLRHASNVTAVFQPIVSLTDGRYIGFEALTRFEDGAPPAERFAEAAQLGIGCQLEEIAIRRALSDATDLPKDCWLAINVSASLLLEEGRLAGLLVDVDRPIVVELTEQQAIIDYPAIRAAVDSLGPNVSLAIDDIGEAFSGLRHLVEFAPAFAKLDLGLVRHIHADPARQALVAALHHYMLQTGAQLVAEGVESDAERQTLELLGVPLAQGFLFGRPAPVQEWMSGARESCDLGRLSSRRPVATIAALRPATAAAD